MNRTITQIVTGSKASDGDSVQLTRIIPSTELDILDPFLLLDAFNTDQPQDYIGGFPAHPHRGFETVTYMLAGKMRHQDSAGHAGVIETGGVQWMRAGKGIIHSEMPEQEQGLLAGLQLWVNLASAHKMDQPQYQEVSAESIPEERRDDFCRVKVIAGQTSKGTQGVINNDWIEPVYWDIRLSEGGHFMDKIPKAHNAFVYVIEGQLRLDEQTLDAQQLAVLGLGEQVTITAQSASRFILAAGKPLNEPVARGGPFVMNTREEIQQAFRDYESGRFASI